jgi:hypothetical protein
MKFAARSLFLVGTTFSIIASYVGARNAEGGILIILAIAIYLRVEAE